MRPETEPSPALAALDEYAERLIRHRARQLVRRRGFVRDDLNDIEQDLRLDLLRRLPKFDVDRASRNTFIARVVDHAVATIIERQTAACRDGRLTRCYTDCEVEDDEGERIPFEDTFDATDYLRLTGRAEPESAKSIGLRAALERALESLPPDLQDLAGRLATCSITEISRQTGIPRTTLYARLGEVRSHLLRADLEDYL